MANERTNNMTEASSESRYHRQESLLAGEGWEQSKLNRARVAVIGSDALANYAALTLSAFGFGNIDIYFFVWRRLSLHIGLFAFHYTILT